MEKQKKQKLVFKIISFLLVFACACGIVFSYETATNTVGARNRINQRVYEALSYDIPQTFIYLDADMKELDRDTLKSKMKVVWSEYALENLSEAQLKQYEDQAKDEYIDYHYTWYMLNDKNLSYQVIDHPFNYSGLNSDTFVNYEYNKELRKKYRLFIDVHFDENGNVSDQCFDSSKKQVIGKNMIHTDSLYNYQSTFYDETIGELNYTVQYETPKNKSFIFAVNEDIITDYSSIIYNAAYNYDGIGTYILYILPYVLIAFFILALWVLFYPIRIVKECQPFHALKDIKAEIVVFISGWMIGLGFVGIAALTSMSLNGVFLEFLKDLGWQTNSAQAIITLCNILAWILILYFMMYVVFMVKYVFHKGFKAYWKENTVFMWLWYKISNASHRMVQIDLDSKRNRTLLKIVGLNAISMIALFVVMVILMRSMLGYYSYSSPTLMFLFILVYSIILLIVAKKEYDKIGNDYDKLLKATKKLSDGDFNVDIHEDLGVFNSLRDELTDIKNGFEKAVKEEVKSQRMKTELISNVSHDLKTPLTSIITYVDLLKNEAISEEERQQYVATLDRNALRLKNLIDDLFEVSKVNSGNVSLNLVDVDVVALIKQAQFECLDKLNEANLDVRTTFSEDKIIYQLDSSKTYRIFENLFVNIAKYALPNTRVYVNVEALEDRVLISFKNISANEIDFDAEEITERFVQGDKSRNSGGSGLGLAIAKSFTELQNGSFKIEIDGDLFKAMIQFRK